MLRDMIDGRQADVVFVKSYLKKGERELDSKCV
jgi:hypothetical protein